MLLDCFRLKGFRPHCLRSSDGHSPAACPAKLYAKPGLRSTIKLKGKIFVLIISVSGDTSPVLGEKHTFYWYHPVCNENTKKFPLPVRGEERVFMRASRTIRTFLIYLNIYFSFVSFETFALLIPQDERGLLCCLWWGVFVSESLLFSTSFSIFSLKGVLAHPFKSIFG